MATFVAARSSTASGSVSTANVVNPTDLAVGDLMIAFVMVEYQATAYSKSGWVNCGAYSNAGGYNDQFTVMTKIADAADISAGSTNWPQTDGAVHGIGVTVVAYRSAGQWLATPVTVGTFTSQTGTTNVTTSSITTSSTKTVVVAGSYLSSYAAAWAGTVSGLTNRINYGIQGYVSQSVWDTTQTVAGTTGPFALNAGNSSSIESNCVVSSVILTLDEEVNQVPNAPTGISVAGAVAPGGNPVASWTHNDPDSNPQSKYQIRWRRV